MAPEKPVLPRRVRVSYLVRMTVMMTMVGGPPEWSTLHRRSPQHGKDKLSCARGLKRAMRKIAVVESSDGKHTDKVENTGGYDRGPTPPNPKHSEACEMHDGKRKH